MAKEVDVLWSDAEVEEGLDGPELEGTSLGSEYVNRQDESDSSVAFQSAGSRED